MDKSFPLRESAQQFLYGYHVFDRPFITGEQHECSKKLSDFHFFLGGVVFQGLGASVLFSL